MALGQLTLTRADRERVAILVRALVIAQLVIAVCIVIFCYNVSARALGLMLHIRRRTVLFLYGTVVLHAYCMKLHYTMGLRLITLLLKYSYWPRVNSLCLAWMTLGMLVALNGTAIALTVRATVRLLGEDIREALRVGITQYLTEPVWKKLFDSIQVELRCCGIDRPTDWYETPWINMDFLNENSDLVLKMAGSDACILPPVTPFSCCNPHILGACYHDPLQQTSAKDIWQDKAELVAHSLHERGCLDAVREPLERAAYVLQASAAAVLIIQVGVLILTQALRTSARGAVLAGRCAGPARAWLLASAAPSSTLLARRPQDSKSGLRCARSSRGAGGTSTAMLLLERGRAARERRGVAAAAAR